MSPCCSGVSVIGHVGVREDPGDRPRRPELAHRAVADEQRERVAAESEASVRSPPVPRCSRTTASVPSASSGCSVSARLTAAIALPWPPVCWATDRSV